MADLEKVIKESEEAIDILAKAEEPTFLLDFVRCAFENALALLKEQQPKTGHWVVLTMCANEGTYCSECSTKVFDFVHPPKKKLSQYCPHCGAKMEKQP